MGISDIYFLKFDVVSFTELLYFTFLLLLVVLGYINFRQHFVLFPDLLEFFDLISIILELVLIFFMADHRLLVIFDGIDLLVDS